MLHHRSNFSALSPFVLVSVLVACGGGEVPASGGSGGGGESPGGGGAGATGGGGNGGIGGTGANAGEGGLGGDGGFGGDGGQTAGGGGAGGGWPTCDVQPPDLEASTIADVWAADPAGPTEYWVPGVYVTAVAGDGCESGVACQFFVQQQESFASLAAATKQSLRVGVSPSTANYFTQLAVGDRVDLRAFAFRDTANGKNELFFFVSTNLPGCAEVVGAGSPQPVLATLADLSVDAYETTMGPVLVRIDTVSGNPNAPEATFGLWDTGAPIDPMNPGITSLSPFFLDTKAFTGLTDGLNTNFSEVVGVFGIFAPPADPLIKYEEIYVRSELDYPLL